MTNFAKGLVSFDDLQRKRTSIIHKKLKPQNVKRRKSKSYVLLCPTVGPEERLELLSFCGYIKKNLTEVLAQYAVV